MKAERVRKKFRQQTYPLVGKGLQAIGRLALKEPQLLRLFWIIEKREFAVFCDRLYLRVALLGTRDLFRIAPSV